MSLKGLGIEYRTSTDDYIQSSNLYKLSKKLDSVSFSPALYYTKHYAVASPEPEALDTGHMTV